MTDPKSLAVEYDEKYRIPNYFHYNEALYAPFIASLVSYCKLPAGATVLDVGCGQGFFSFLLAKQGLTVHGVDLSESGIAIAQQEAAHSTRFTVADVQLCSFPEPFDCVFVRSCSLYNTPDLQSQRNLTDKLLEFLKPRGLLIFVYNSTLRPESDMEWRQHSVSSVREHFSVYPEARIFFINRVTLLFLRRLSFTGLGSWSNAMMTKLLGKGGDFVCIVEKDKLQARDEVLPASRAV